MRAVRRWTGGAWSSMQVTAVAGIGGAVLLARRAPGASLEAGRWPAFVAGLVLMRAGIGVSGSGRCVTLGRFFTIEVRVQARPDRRRPRALIAGCVTRRIPG